MSLARAKLKAMTDVLIVGAGPVGLMAAYCLCKHGVKVRIVEKLVERTPFSKALAVQPHTAEVFAQLGRKSAYSKSSCQTSLISKLLERSTPLNKQFYHEGGELLATMSSYIPCDFKSMLAISQREIETILESQLKEEFGVETDRCWELKEIENLNKLNQSSTNESLICHFDRVHFVGKGDLSAMGIDYTDSHWNDKTITPTSAPTAAVEDTKMTVEASWLIAADGSHSTVRHMLGVPFEGVTLAHSGSIEMIDVFLRSRTPNGEPAYKPSAGGLNLYNHPDGICFVAQWKTDYGASNITETPTADNAITYRIAIGDNKTTNVVGRRAIGRSDADVLREVERRLSPLKFAFGPILWKTQFCINERKVNEYRHRGRFFLAGDAAHVHSPAGGLGMNTGLQDAFNLAWKIGFVAKHDGKLNADVLLNSYSAEREPIARDVLATSGRLIRAFTVPIFMRKLFVKMLAATGMLSRILREREKATLKHLYITYRNSPIVQAQPAPTKRAGAANPFSWFARLFTSTPPRALQGQYFRDCHVVPPEGGKEEELYRHFGYCSSTLVVFCGKATAVEILKQVGASLDRYDSIIQMFLIVPSNGTPMESASGSSSTKIFGDPGGRVHDEFGVSNTAGYIYMVRPDGYVGYQGALADRDKFEAHLKTFIAIKG